MTESTVEMWSLVLYFKEDRGFVKIANRKIKCISYWG